MAAAPPLEVDLNGVCSRLAAILAMLSVAPGIRADVHIVIVEGLGGESAYVEAFADQVDVIATAAASLAGPPAIRVFRADEATREAVLRHFDTLAADIVAGDRVLVYLVGHGSYDEHDYKFNIRGPDLSGTDLAAALAALPSEDQLVVATGSASGALADALEDPARTLLVATRSGIERHATRFGTYFAAALGDAAADTDKDDIVDAAEAFAYAARLVADFYEREGRLATEHARLDGERAERFPLARLTDRRRIAGADAELERLQAERDALTASIAELRDGRDALPAEAYRDSLRQRLIELARLEDAIEARRREVAAGD